MNATPSDFLIIANPVSGSRSAPRIALDIGDILKAGGKTVDIHTTTHPGDAAEQTRKALASNVARCIVGCGGDGTLHEIATVLEGTSIPLGIIPRGRCNDFAQELGLFRRDTPQHQAQVLLNGKIRVVDLGAVGSKRFLTVATMGFDSEASRFVETRKLWIKGTPAYLYAVLRVLVSYRFPMVHLEGDFGSYKGRVLLAATGNTPCYGGAMRIAPGARMDDGLFHITVVEELPRLTVLKVLPRVIKGTHITHPKVRVFTSRRIEIKTPDAPVWVCADGESLVQTPCSFEIRPRSLRVIVP